MFLLRDGLLAAERFFFDLSALCEQLGLPVEGVAAELRVFRGDERGPGRSGSQEFVVNFVGFWRAPVDLERLTDLVEPGVRLMLPALGTANGIAAAKEVFRQVFTRMPDFRVELQRWSATGDAVYLELVLCAILARIIHERSGP